MAGVVLKLIISICCVIGTIGYSRALINYLGFNINLMPEGFAVFALGCLLYTLLWIFVFSRRDKFWSVLEHEMTHLLFAILFFKKVHSFNAIRGSGGSVEIEGDNFVIALAPYFFPLATIIILVIKPSFPLNVQWLFNGLLGFSLMFHIISLFKEFHPDQPDLRRSGMLFSSTVILFFNLFFVGLCIASLQGSWADMWDYVQFGFNKSVAIVERFAGLFIRV